MAVDTNSLTKLYYSIGEVAEMFDVSTSLIRYWENEFDSLRPHKNSKGDRRFTVQNIEELNTIYHLVKEKGFTLDGAKAELKHIQERALQKKSLVKELTKIQKGLKKLSERL